jgi:peroxidase
MHQRPNLAPLDVTSSDKFDNSYYTNLKSNKVLLESDQALMGDPQAAAMVESYSMNPLLFYTDFVASMIKLGNVGVLTGQNGEIRKKCGSVN